MTSLTRGPLPPRVYWRRRVLLVCVAVLLVFGLARVLDAGSDASSAPNAATPVAAVPTSTVTATAGVSPSAGQRVERTQQQKKKHQKRRQPVLAAPDGACADEDIAVTPTVPKAVAGRDVFLVLELRTIAADACTWEVSPETLTLKITSGDDDIWASRQCPRVVPTRSVVVRSAVSTSVGVTWNARRSDEECSRLTHWALPGFYHLAAAALAGEPAEVQFELEAPTPVVITRSPKPKQEPRDEPGQGKKTPVGRR